MLGISRSCWLAGAERTLLTLWVGGLWIIGYLVAPTLFTMLDDRQLAGQLAGRLFHVMGYVGLASGGLLLLSLWLRDGLRQWRVWVLLAMLLLVAVGSFVLQPMMQELKLQGIAEGTAAATRFGRLHGVSSVLYLATSLLGLSLVSLGIRRGVTQSEQGASPAD
jgi:hypothetical protein